MVKRRDPHNHPKRVHTQNMPNKGLKQFWADVNAGKIADPRTHKKKKHTA